MPSPLPYDIRAYRRLRWRARVVTVLLLAPAVPGVSMLVSAPTAFVFVYLSLYLMLAGWGIWTAWRTSFRARPQPWLAEQGPGARLGVPELDEPPRPHLGLTGERPPPTRW